MKFTVSISTCIAASAFAALSVLAPTQASAKQYNMCSWEEIPGHVLNRIENRSDYQDILQRMFDNCPESALSLTDRPTASINEGWDPEDVERNGEAQYNGSDDGGRSAANSGDSGTSGGGNPGGGNSGGGNPGGGNPGGGNPGDGGPGDDGDDGDTPNEGPLPG